MCSSARNAYARTSAAAKSVMPVIHFSQPGLVGNVSRMAARDVLIALLAASGGALASFLGLRAWFGTHPREAFPGELKMLRTVIAKLPDSIYVKDLKSRFVVANQGTAEVVHAASSEEILGKTDFDFFPRVQAQEFFADEQRLFATGEVLSKPEPLTDAHGQTRHYLTTKVPLLDDRGAIIGLIGIGRNITAIKETEAALERAREELRFKASHDALTGLFNREAILELLVRELARSSREHGCIAVLLIDVDHFKAINDTHGHLVGDAVLREAAVRLLKSVRSYDLVGRYGGEEFLVILTNCPPDDALARADEIRMQMMASPLAVDAGGIAVTISAGVLVTQRQNTLTPEQILREVDVALYQAKTAGRNCCRLACRPAA